MPFRKATKSFVFLGTCLTLLLLPSLAQADIKWCSTKVSRLNDTTIRVRLTYQYGLSTNSEADKMWISRKEGSPHRKMTRIKQKGEDWRDCSGHFQTRQSVRTYQYDMGGTPKGQTLRMKIGAEFYQGFWTWARYYLTLVARV